MRDRLCKCLTVVMATIVRRRCRICRHLDGLADLARFVTCGLTSRVNAINNFPVLIKLSLRLTSVAGIAIGTHNGDAIYQDSWG